MAVTLSFGTAGIRAPMGEGEGKLNPGTVHAVAQALLGYAREVIANAETRGIVLGYDGRAHSAEFAQVVADVAASLGVRVRAFQTPVPTPLVALAARRHGAALGVMVTASHNPAADNGIKVYWEGGAQIRAPHDGEVAARIRATAYDAEARAPASRPEPLGDEDMEAYLAAVDALVPAPTQGALPRIAYTAMCGVGSPLTHRLLSRLGVNDWVEVEEQAAPRSDFGGLASPNPEDPRAIAQLLALAEREGAELGLAHDPDADRLAVAIRTRAGHLRPLTGDEVGALLGAFMLELHGGRAALVSTLVSSGLLGELARARSARFERTLTGFKWISQRGRALEASEGVPFVFGYEEAIGYGFFTLADDKDGFAAMRVLLELVRRLRAQGQTLEDQLDAFARQHGLFATRQVTIKAQPETMRALVARARALSPGELLGEGATLTDYALAPERADLAIFSHPGGARVCVRPSGTEPKIKVYLEVREPVAPGEPVDAAKARAASRLDGLVARLAAHGVG